jgi:hypothetical protein
MKKLIDPRQRKRRSSPKWPGLTIRQFAHHPLVGTTESIVRGMVASGQIVAIDVNGVKIIPPREVGKWTEMWGTPEAATEAAE